MFTKALFFINRTVFPTEGYRSFLSIQDIFIEIEYFLGSIIVVNIFKTMEIIESSPNDREKIKLEERESCLFSINNHSYLGGKSRRMTVQVLSRQKHKTLSWK
jgi:hypothetical protein